MVVQIIVFGILVAFACVSVYTYYNGMESDGTERNINEPNNG